MTILRILEHSCKIAHLINLIASTGGASTAELLKLSGMTAPTLYRQLGFLRAANLVKFTQEEYELGQPYHYFPLYKVRIVKI